MNGQPTPGPWEWWTSCSWKRLTSKDSKGSWMKQGNVICPTVASDGHPDLIVSEADMALIASAPDLLVALAGLLDRYVSLVNSGDAGFWDPEAEEEVIDARAAIARATSTHDMGVVSHG